MTPRNALIDKLANSSLGLNKGIAVLFGLAVLSTGISYWGVQRVIKEQRDSVEFHFARLMENIREHEAFLDTVSRESAKGRLLESLHDPLFVQGSVSEEGSNVYIGREYSFSLAFSVKVNPAIIPALQHTKITALGAHLANYYSAYWSASHYQSPQAWAFNVPANFEISVPAAGRLRGGGHNLAGELPLVMQKILARHYDNIQSPSQDQVHWLPYTDRSGANTGANILSYINIDLPSAQLHISGASPRVVVSTLLNLAQASNRSVYDHFNLVAPTGEVMVGSQTQHMILHEGLNLNSDGLVFRVTSPGDQPWTGIYVIGFKKFLDSALWPSLGLIALVLAGLGCGRAYNRWYKKHVVVPARQAHDEIAERETFSRAVIESAPTGLCVVRCSDHKVLLENQLALQSRGTAALIAVLDQHPELSAHGKTMLEVDGHHLHVGFVYTRYNGQDAWLCAFHDVTRHIEDAAILEEAREIANSANQAKTRFLATMSHEIRTPLYGVLGTLELLGLTRLEPRQQEYLHTIQRSSATLFQLISDVLDVSKIESGQMSLDIQNFCPLDITEDTMSTYSAFALSKGLQLYACIDCTLPDRVRGDPVRIRQVLNNLLSNAIKFTDSGQVVLWVRVLELNDEYSTLQWQISDSGIGISPAQQLQLFNPFYQVRNASSESGAGLGLSICQKLCELMGGQLNVISEPGLGSSFSLQLRLAREPGELGDCPVFETHTAPVYVRAQAPELAQHVCAWLNRLGVHARILNPNMHTVQHSTLLVDMLAGDSHQGWPGQRIIATPGGRNPPEYRAGSWEVDANAIRAIAWAVSFAQHGNRVPRPASLSRQHQPLKLRVLVAEDNSINRAIIKEQLEALGCSAVAAANGELALALWFPDLFDLVLTDVNMPVLNGYELAAALRRKDPALPIIGITANAMPEEGKRCADAGMNTWMVKPLSLPTLRAQLLTYCKGATLETVVETVESPISGNSVEQIQLSPRMRGLFISAMHEDVHLTQVALDSGNAGSLAHQLHSMGGALAAVQAAALSDICAALELQLAGQAISPRLARDVNSLLKRLETLLKKLETFKS